MAQRTNILSIQRNTVKSNRNKNGILKDIGSMQTRKYKWLSHT